MAVYNTSKAGVIALSETLYGELRPRGVGVTVVCPGVMPTRFAERANFDDNAYRRLTQKYVAASMLAPDAVADAALRGMHRGDLYIVEGRPERWYWRAKRLFPGTLLRRVARRVRQDLRSLT
jgi:short-subunit dehydrogenase